MLHKIDGLPAHILLIHVIVVGLPLAAVMLVASAVWPAARRRLGFLSPLVALGVLAFVPVTTSAGKWLLTHDFGTTPPPNALHHEHLGDWVWPWAAGIFVMSTLVWLLGRRSDAAGGTTRTTRTGRARGADPAAIDDAAPGGSGATAVATRSRLATAADGTRAVPTVPIWTTVVIAVLSVAVAVGGVYWVFLTGEAGAHLVYGG